ncbi:MAG: BatA and WFA domain-containing protein [Chthoniobacteraceae bacterium]
MTLLTPFALWFLTIIPVIVLLYLLKLKRRQVQVSTLIFWQRVLQENRRRALFQRLRQWLSLLLHLLIFLLILFALAKPEFDRFVKNGASTVLVLDARARMQAVEKNGETRFEKAKKLLTAYTSRAGDQNQMALLVAHGSAEVVIPFTGDEKVFQQAIAKLEPSDASGDLDGVIRLADELLASRGGPGRIVLFTDTPMQIADHKAQLETVPVGSSLNNLAITRFATRALPASPQTAQVLLETHNFGDKAVAGNVELYFDRRLIDVKPFTLQPGGHKTDTFSSVPIAGPNSRGWLTARLDTADPLACDNEAYAVLPNHEPSHVLLVTRGNWFIEKMLASDDLLKFDLLTPDAFRPEMAKDFDAVILDNVLPDGLNLQNAQGNFLFISKTPFASGVKPIDQPLITDVDASSPLMRMVNLKNVTFLRATEIPLPESGGGWNFNSPLRSFDHPLVISGSRKINGTDQRMAAFAFDIADSDLPLRVAFPLLMSNTLEWLAGRKTDEISSYKAGETINLQPDQSLWMEPQRKFLPLPKIDPAQMAHHSYQPLKNGFYLLQTGSDKQWIAVNTFSEAESNLRTVQESSGQEKAPSRIPDFALITARPIWNYLALAAFVLFTIEWWLYHRRRTE